MLLAPTLEYALMHALLNQDISYVDLDPKTLTQLGRVFWEGTQKLKDWDIKGVTLYATEVCGQDKGRVQEYLTNVSKNATDSAVDIHKMLRERQVLLDLSNTIQEQLVSGDLDISALNTITASGTGATGSTLESVEFQLVGGAPEAPAGPRLRSLPKISEATNGVFGMWVIGGVPKVGKSTLALQIAVDVSVGGTPVLYYDYENGPRVMLHRLVQSVGIDGARKLGKNLYIRGSLHSLNKDLATMKQPGLVIVDSIQRLGTGSDDARSGLNKWIDRLETLKREHGYSVLMISEIPRSAYTGDPRLDIYKESGRIEYAVDSAFALVDRGQFTAVHLVANRHYETKGQVALLERHKGFWFKETNV